MREDSDPTDPRNGLCELFQTLADYCRGEEGQPRDIAARPHKAGDEPARNRICSSSEDDGEGPGGLLGCQGGGVLAATMTSPAGGGPRPGWSPGSLCERSCPQAAPRRRAARRGGGDSFPARDSSRLKNLGHQRHDVLLLPDRSGGQGLRLLAAEDHPEGHAHLVAAHGFLVRDGILGKFFGHARARGLVGRRTSWHLPPMAAGFGGSFSGGMIRPPQER